MSLEWVDWDCPTCGRPQRTVRFWRDSGRCYDCGRDQPLQVVIAQGQTLTVPSQPRVGKCAYCGEAVLRLYPRTGPYSSLDIDWRPWSANDETPPERDYEGKPLTEATRKRWREERPYRIGLVVVNLHAGTYENAVNRPRGKPADVMYKPHWCADKETKLYGNRNS